MRVERLIAEERFAEAAEAALAESAACVTREAALAVVNRARRAALAARAHLAADLARLRRRRLLRAY